MEDVVDKHIELKKAVEAFIEEKEESVKIPFQAMFKVDNCLTVLGWKREEAEGMPLNEGAWSVDWYHKYTKDNSVMYVSGSVWNSSEIKFQKSK